MISKIKLRPDSYEGYDTTENKKNLDKLSRLNIFIGTNNSGKSRLLRSLFIDSEYQLELSNFHSSKIVEILKKILSEVSICFFRAGIEEASTENIPGTIKVLEKLIAELSLVSVKNIAQTVENFRSFWQDLKSFRSNGGSHRQGYSDAIDWNTLNKEVKAIASKYNNFIEDLVPNKVEYNPQKVYIPILRGLRSVQLKEDGQFDELSDNYYKRTIKDYFSDKSVENSEIYTGLRLYEDLKKMLLGKREEREKVKQFESFLSKTFFNSESVSLTPRINDDSVHVLIGEAERAIYELGDGIQSIIILLYPLFFNQGKDLLVFIEEPENSIHPGLQRLFIETLMKNEFNTFQYFITTHSNHFLDITLDLKQVSVYTVQKRSITDDPKVFFVIENVSNDNFNTLDLIGVRNSAVFLSNCTIWVEGITDRLYIKKYLEVYQDKLVKEKKITTSFREDYNFSFVEYGGGNIVHWSFGDQSQYDKIKTSRISSKVFLIIDKDDTENNSDSAKAKRIKSLKQQLNNNLYILSGREIENTIDSNILIQTIKTLEGENFKNIKYDAVSIVYEKYKNEKIGSFIESKFKKHKRRYKADSGTLYCKIDFCKAAIDSIKSFDDLSKEGKVLALKLFEFIKSAN